ncbi:hypothetical protein LXL04_005137 [Taraxacum kok-saghyz]
MAIPVTSILLIVVLTVLSTTTQFVEPSSDNNKIFSPCADATIQRSDGFTFGIAFAARSVFFFNSSVQLSPCDRRLSLSSSNSQVTALCDGVPKRKATEPSCSGKSNFVCLNNQDCAIRTNSCKNRGGTVDCSVGIQLAFSGTDKHETVFNSWYEVKILRQYSLFGLYKNLKDSLTDQYNSFF